MMALDQTDSGDIEYDHCVQCSTVTKYKKTDHIDIRLGYIEGSGQYCSRCYYNNRFIRKMHY